MKPKIIITMILSIVLSFSNVKLQAQNGCDLCGPASGSYKNVASGAFSATIGVACESRGQYSFAIGYAAKAMMANTIAIGKGIRAQASNSFVIGTGPNTTESLSLVNNISNSLMIGFNSALPTLFISKSSTYNTTGKVGIGNITSPKAKLHIISDANEDAGIILESSNSSKIAYIQLFDINNRIVAQQNIGLTLMSHNASINFEANQIQMNAPLTINTENGISEEYDYALSVKGGIMTTKVLVKDVADWYDYVFEDDYKLLSIDNVKRYIDENGHLPDIPSEQDILKNGYDMVEMDGLLLKKIEELTLYAIELNNLVKSQQKVIEDLLSE